MVKLVCGVGINDAGYVVQPTTGGVRHICPYYRKWKSVLVRCYHSEYHEKQQTYKDCQVCKDWVIFSSFKSWMQTQDWEGKDLDKDLLVRGNKVYSPETCVFITKALNNFTTSHEAGRGEYLIGVSRPKDSLKFSACCSDPFKVSSYRIGQYDTEVEAHKAWQAKKHEYACQLAELQADPRVADALRQRYAPDKDWTKG